MKGLMLATAALTALVSLAALSIAVTPGRGARGSSGPLAFKRIRADQKVNQLQFKLEFERPIPSLEHLGPHPRIDLPRPARFLCLDLESRSTGRLLICPAGKLKHGRIDVGVSKLRGGKPRPQGKIRAAVERSKTSLQLSLPLAAIGLEPGELKFSALSGWSGPACGPVDGDRKTSCRDRAPLRGEAQRRIRAVQAVGCGGVHLGKVFNGGRGRKEVALTFDDGPSIYTEDVLGILDRFGVHATFFQIGQQVPSFPGVDRDILAQGSEIGNHSLRHEEDPQRPSLEQTSSLIRRASGFNPCLFRPPYGDAPTSTVSAASSLGMVTVIWDVDTRDYTLPGSGTIASRATAVQPGSIVLMHDGGGNRSETVAALPSIIKNLKSRGYKLVTLTKLLGGRFQLKEVHGRVAPAASLLPAPSDYPLWREGP